MDWVEVDCIILHASESGKALRIKTDSGRYEWLPRRACRCVPEPDQWRKPCAVEVMEELAYEKGLI